jgi:hypothetical protein
MRIEFMAPEEFKRHNDIRVDIQKGVHAVLAPGVQSLSSNPTYTRCRENFPTELHSPAKSA